MNDIGQALVTGGTAIVGVTLGASLTYLFGSMNRRHQEAREDETRWYDARREAYAAFLIATSQRARTLSDLKPQG
jgi:hypothetical protein